MMTCFTTAESTCPNGSVLVENIIFEEANTVTLASEAGLYQHYSIIGFPILERTLSHYCLYKPSHPFSSSLCGFRVNYEADLKDSELTIFPNPAANEILLNSGTGSVFDQNIYLYNMQGIEIVKIEIPHLDFCKINVENLPVGNYILSTYLDGKMIRKMLSIVR
jgi:hypothetical protein